MKIGGWSSLKILERYLRRNQKNFILAVQSLDFMAPICHQSPKIEEKAKLVSNISN
jgi:hypothetical protein